MHQPVLLKEILDYLNPKPGENFIDCTFGFGGHRLAILKENGPQGKVLGIEQDKEVLKIVSEQSAKNKRLILIKDNFNNLKKIIEKNEFNRINGILLDLGISSWHLDKSGRGFSFQVSERSEPLMMNCSEDGLTAEEIINQWTKDELIRIFREYGEERFARGIAEVICRERQNRQIKTIKQLVDIIKRAVPEKYKHGRIHFATKTFQALRIAVNDELVNLENVLPQALEVLENHGRLVIISFHSLEDRIVKNFFRQSAKEDHLKILTKKPIGPSQEEINLNPRSRSAKLRAGIKI